MITAHVLSLNLKIKKNRITNFFHKNGFYKRILKNNEFPHELFSIIDNEVKDPQKNSKIVFCHLSNYTYQKIDTKLSEDSGLRGNTIYYCSKLNVSRTSPLDCL